MSISKRQFDLLQAMGITVWQRRDLPDHSSAVESTQRRQHSDNISNCVTSTNEQASLTPSHATSPQTNANQIIEIDLKVLLKKPLFIEKKLYAINFHQITAIQTISKI